MSSNEGVAAYVVATLLFSVVGVTLALWTRRAGAAAALVVAEVRPPGWVRAVAVLSVGVAAGTLLVCTPLGVLGTSFDTARYFYRDHTAVDGPADFLITLTLCTGLGLAPLLGTTAVLVARGRALAIAPFVALLWAVHVACASIGSSLRAIGESMAHQARHPELPSDFATWVAGSTVVLVLGLAHAAALYAAARRMRELQRAAS